MTDTIPSAPAIVHIYYDRPVLYTTPLPFGLSAMVVFADESDDSDAETWLVAPMTPKMRDGVHAGRVDVRDAFDRPFGGMVGQATIDATGRVIAMQWVPAAEIPSDCLPMHGARLDAAPPAIPTGFSTDITTEINLTWVPSDPGDEPWLTARGKDHDLTAAELRRLSEAAARAALAVEAEAAAYDHPTPTKTGETP